jgi:hypothetical protein
MRHPLPPGFPHISGFENLTFLAARVHEVNRKNQRADVPKLKKPPTDVAALMDAWARLDDFHRAPFFAALLRAAMAKVGSKSGLMLWINVALDCDGGERPNPLGWDQPRAD